MKRILLIVIIAVIVAGLLYTFFTRDKKEGNDFIKVSGNIETTEVDVGFKIPGRIVSRFFEEGDWVDRRSAKLDDEDFETIEVARAADVASSSAANLAGQGQKK
jgi:HlyD family secretion protein